MTTTPLTAQEIEIEGVLVQLETLGMYGESDKIRAALSMLISAPDAAYVKALEAVAVAAKLLVKLEDGDPLKPWHMLETALDNLKAKEADK